MWSTLLELAGLTVVAVGLALMWMPLGVTAVGASMLLVAWRAAS